MRSLLLLVVLIAGCTSASPLTAPDGRPGFAVSCSGKWNSTGDCYRKAGEACPAGYNVFAGGMETGGVLVPLANGGLLGTTTATRHLVVSCR